MWLQTAFSVWVKTAEQLKRVKGDLVCRTEVRKIRKKNRTLVYVILFILVMNAACWLMNTENKTMQMWLLVWPFHAVWYDHSMHLRSTLRPASDISDQWCIIICPIEKVDLKVDLFSINRLPRNWSIKAYSLCESSFKNQGLHWDHPLKCLNLASVLCRLLSIEPEKQWIREATSQGQTTLEKSKNNSSSLVDK